MTVFFNPSSKFRLELLPHIFNMLNSVTLDLLIFSSFYFVMKKCKMPSLSFIFSLFLNPPPKKEQEQQKFKQSLEFLKLICNPQNKGIKNRKICRTTFQHEVCSKLKFSRITSVLLRTIIYEESLKDFIMILGTFLLDWNNSSPNPNAPLIAK